MRQVLSRDPEINVEQYANGLIIRAGQYPDLTPLTEGLSPHYLAVNQLIRPIRVKHEEGHSLHFYGINHFDEQSTQAWYARYDQGSLAVSPLKSGTPALVGGYWTTPSDPHSMRYIGLGEMAPLLAGTGETWWDLDHEAADFRNVQSSGS